MNTAIRLVKCPRCLKILPELPNIPVYKCGSCGTILQAKRQKYGIKGNDLRAQESDRVHKYEPNSVSSSSSPGGDNDHQSSHSSPRSSTRGEQFNSEKPVGANPSVDYSHSTKVNYHQDDKMSPEKNKLAVQGEDERLLVQDDLQRKSEPLIHISDIAHDRTSAALSDSGDSLHDEDEDSSTEISNSGKIYDIKGNDSSPQETDPIQKYELNSVLGRSSSGGDNLCVESSKGCDMRGDQFNSVKPVDTISSDHYSHSTELNYLQDVKSSPEKHESEVQGKRGRLLDQEDVQQKSEPLIHISEKPHDRSSAALSDSGDSLHEDEDSSTEISNSGKIYDIKGNNLRPQETDPIQKYEPNSVLGRSSSGGDNLCVKSSKGCDMRGDQFNSVKPVDTISSDHYSHLTELNYFQEVKSSPEKHESEVQGKRERLLDQEDVQQKSEPLIHISEKPHDRSSAGLSDSCDSLHENEDSSTEISNSGKKYDIKGNDSSPQETDPIQKYEPNFVSNSSSSGGDNPFVESSPGSDTRGDHSNSVKPVNTNSSDHYSHPTELNYLQGDKSSPEKNESKVQGERERLLDQHAEQQTDEYLFHSAEKPQDRTPGEISDSCDSLHDNEDSSIDISNPEKKHEEGFSSKLNAAKSVYVLEDSHGELAEEEKSSGEPKSLDEPGTTSSPKSEPLKLVVAKVQQNIENGIERYPNDIQDFQGEFENPNDQQSLNEPATHFSVNESLKLGEENRPSSVEKEHRELDETRYLSTENGRMRQNEFPHHIVEYSQNRETVKDTSSFSMKGKEIIAARGPLVKSSVFAPLTPDEEYLEGFQEVGPSFHRVSSEETLVTLPINPRVPIGSMSKSPTGIYYAGDESESSFDGTKELSTQVSRVRKFKGTGTTTTSRLRQKDGFRNKNKQNGELQMHNEQSDLLSKLKQPNIFSIAESPEHRKHSHQMRTSTIAANKEPISREPYMPRSSQLFYGNSSPASSTHSVSRHNGEFRRPDTMSATDPEKIELLRMVYELEDRINRTHLSKPMSGEILRTAGYYEDPTTGRDAYVNFRYSGQQRSHLQGVGWDNQHRSSSQAFSGEAVLCRNHIDCRCSHCYHQSLNFSQKLSSHCIHCQHEAYNTYPSYSPSKQYYSSSEISPEIQADNRNKNNEMKKYLREKTEKRQVMKRHIRPGCGGAPIVNCYHCSELLQIPADFLLFRRRYHNLRCNACNRILKFSLLEKSHLVPHVIKIQAPPPSRIVDRTLASTLHAKKPQVGEPVSFSENFKPSLSRNGSIESGPSVPSSHQKNLFNGKLPSDQTFQTTNYRKAKTFMEIYQDKNKNSRFDIEVAAPSSSTSRRVKPSSEIEELPATSGSPLHRLMGYESPGQVLFAKSEDDSDDGMGFYMNQHVR